MANNVGALESMDPELQTSLQTVRKKVAIGCDLLPSDFPRI